MRRTLASFILAFSFAALPIDFTAQSTRGESGIQQSGQPGATAGSATEPQAAGGGRTYGEVNQPNSPGYETDEARGGFDFGWLGLLGLAGLLGLRHTTNRNAAVTR
jgi:MYXO-CTERM domain-containing protein